MAEENEDAASKTEEPTPRKLQQAREKGDVPKTQDLGTLASFVAAAGVIAIAGGWMCRNMVYALLPFIAHPDTMDLAGHGSIQVAKIAMMAAAPMVVAVTFAAAVAGVAGNLVQTGLMFTPDKVMPDFKKVSPMGAFKRIFGPDGLMQFFKSVVKIGLVSYVSWVIIKPSLGPMKELAALDPMAILPLVTDITKRLVFAVAGLTLVVTGADYMWQRQRFMKRMRMSKEELKEDYKSTEGDPHIKAKRKQIQYMRSRRRMMAAVKDATVVVMNPTHYAVALKYEDGAAMAPQCVAKGLDDLALKIRAVAEEAGVPVVEDPPLARALYAAVEIDDVIPPAHYEAVARVIGFIMQSGKKALAKAGR